MIAKDRFGNDLNLDDKVLVPVYDYSHRYNSAVLKEGRIYNITVEGEVCVNVFDHPCYEDFESKDVIKLPIGGAKND